MRKLLTAILLPGIVLLAGTAAADGWPQFRGPGRDAVSREKGLLKSWPGEGPKLLWHVRDVGYGYGSVAVDGERLYLTASRGLNDELLAALDAKDGRPLWTARLGKVGNPDQQPSYPGARSTPTVDGALVYALGSDGDLLCAEAASGRERWRRSLRADFGGKPGVWAYSESPLIDGDRVIVTPGGPGAAIVALEKRTGDVAWKAAVPGDDAAGYSSAVVLESGGVRQVIQFLARSLVGVEAATGRLLWRSERTVDNRFGVHAASPVPAEGHVYSATAAGGALLKLQEGGGAFTAEPLYFERKVPNALGGAVKVGDYLYGTTGSALLCLEYATGRVKWEERSVGAASILFADGRLYLHGENGEVALAEATPEGYRELGRFTPPEPPARGSSRAWNYPALAGGRLYIRDLGSLWVYDVRDPAR